MEKSQTEKLGLTSKVIHQDLVVKELTQNGLLDITGLISPGDKTLKLKINYDEEYYLYSDNPISDFLEEDCVKKNKRREYHSLSIDLPQQLVSFRDERDQIWIIETETVKV